MIEGQSSLKQVRDALHGITGIEQKAEGPDRYLVVARINRELDTVDSFRRNRVPAYWPSYERLTPRKKRPGTCQTRHWRRVGIIPGYVFADIDPYLDFESLLGRVIGAIGLARERSGKPLRIGDPDIRILRRIEISFNTPQPAAKVVHDFKRGEKVSFVDDIVGRWPRGVIEGLAPDGRISVEVELMGRKVPITVLPHQIKRT